MDDAITRWIGWAVGTLLVLAALSLFLMRYAGFSDFLREAERMCLTDDLVRQEESESCMSVTSATPPPEATGEGESFSVASSSLHWTGQAVEGICNGVFLLAVRMDAMDQPSAGGGASTAVTDIVVPATGPDEPATDPVVPASGSGVAVAVPAIGKDGMASATTRRILLDGIPIQAIDGSRIDRNRPYRFRYEVAADGTIPLTRYETIPMP